MSTAGSFQDLVEESFDEASFLWHRWEGELVSPTRNLDEVWSWTEDRLHGALDGVRAGGPDGVEMARQGLLSKELDRVAVSAGLLASTAEPRATDALVSALGSADDESLGAMIRGLELLGSRQALKGAATVLAAGGSAHKAALSRLKAFHRAPTRDDLTAAFASDTAEWQVHALRGARHGQTDALDQWIARGLESKDPNVRYSAVEMGFRNGVKPAWKAATHLAAARDITAGPYLKFIAMLGSAAEHEVVYAALRVPALQSHAMWAVGHIGTAQAVECCISGMRHETIARAAGEAYCWITGADLQRDRLALEEPPTEVPAFEDDDLDANLVPSAEALWPLPDLAAVQRDWSSRQAAFAPNVRHIGGHPLTTEQQFRAVETAPMLRRPDVILELSARTRGSYDVEPRAFTARQRQMMSAARAAASAAAAR